jgi:hypothetical protein
MKLVKLLICIQTADNKEWLQQLFCNYFSASRAADNHEWLELLVCLAWYILILEKGVLARSEKGS